MLNDADAELFDVIVVHKLDRFARNLRVTLETLDHLGRFKVSFASINENMDFSTPIGKVILATLAAFAQYYSDNLSWETKKGKRERKRQGVYNGLPPFGVKRNKDGIPVPDPKTYQGLVLAYQAAADGKSDRKAAQVLNDHGYRTTGNRGSRPFSKDSVRHILTNRFYLGELPDEDGGWIPGKYSAMLDEDLFEAAQSARAANKRDSSAKVRSAAETYLLSGITRCAHCGGPLHIVRNKSGARPRLYGYNRNQGQKCSQRSTFLDVYEDQIAEYLETFQIPANYREQIMAIHANSRADRLDEAARREQIEALLERLKELYSWGDLDHDEYRR